MEKEATVAVVPTEGEWEVAAASEGLAVGMEAQVAPAVEMAFGHDPCRLERREHQQNSRRFPTAAESCRHSFRHCHVGFDCSHSLFQCHLLNLLCSHQLPTYCCCQNDELCPQTS